MAKARKFNTKAMKISTARVKELYDRLLEGETQGSLAREYGLSVVQVGRIARGESRAAETGAAGQPVPNQNIQFSDSEIQASGESVMARLMAEAQALKDSKVESNRQLDDLTSTDKTGD